MHFFVFVDYLCKGKGHFKCLFDRKEQRKTLGSIILASFHGILDTICVVNYLKWFQNNKK